MDSPCHFLIGDFFPKVYVRAGPLSSRPMWGPQPYNGHDYAEKQSITGTEGSPQMLCEQEVG